MRRAAAVAMLSFLSLAGTANATPSGRAVLLANLRAHVKHVFLVYQENRSFDSYFGTFPGAENLATALAKAHGFSQHDGIGNQTVMPYRIAEPDVLDVDHSRPALYAKVNAGAMDHFVPAEETLSASSGVTAQNAQRRGLMTMAYQDCDTVPFYWKWANAFALYDHMFQGMYGPSTPGNIDIISAQTGQSQAAHDPDEVVGPSETGPGVPVYNDLYPHFGPYHNGTPKVTQIDLQFANVLLTLSGRSADQAVVDASGVANDITMLAGTKKPAIDWGWYQEGFIDDGSGMYPAYVAHHDAPQFFGYIRQNPPLWNHVHDLTELFGAIDRGTLADHSVVFVKGGYKNPFGWLPANHDPSVRNGFQGDDDHPGYSDSQLSEALVAKVVDSVARSRYWSDSAIVIAWDDSEGFYDHVPPPQFERCTDGRACGDGPRVPFILISPFARTHAIVSDPGDHGSFVKFLDMLFELPPLATLPDERATMPEGPRDTNPALSDLVGGFDPGRLAGTVAPVSPNEAIVPDSIVNAFPAAMSCSTLGIVPDRVPGGLSAPPPGFAPRLLPSTP
jgi:phospholipase C